MPERIPPSSEVFFKGRPGDTRLGEWVQRGDCQPGGAWTLYGCPDDTGVVANRGRAGAKNGPDAIRKALYRLALPASWRPYALKDAGNLSVADDLAVTHAACEQTAFEVGQSGATGIALGGGHDFGAPNFLGFARSFAEDRWGLINVDPHLDVRPREEGVAHSGTPFRIVLESKRLAPADFIEFGARRNRNTADHWSYCEDLGVQIDEWEAIRLRTASAVQQFAGHLKRLAKACDSLGVTIDLDVCYEAEGSSAAPVLGFSAMELYFMAFAAGTVSKVRYLELAEAAPTLEAHCRVARIGAELVYGFVSGRIQSASKNEASSDS